MAVTRADRAHFQLPSPAHVPDSRQVCHSNAEETQLRAIFDRFICKLEKNENNYLEFSPKNHEFSQTHFYDHSIHQKLIENSFCVLTHFVTNQSFPWLYVYFRMKPNFCPHLFLSGPKLEPRWRIKRVPPSLENMVRIVKSVVGENWKISLLWWGNIGWKGNFSSLSSSLIVPFFWIFAIVIQKCLW